MTMQTDVLSGHLHQSGFIVTQSRSRVKGVSIRGTASAGQFDLFATTTAPVAGTYGRSGTTVTVTKVAHGLKTNDVVGITFSPASGVAATPGNYAVTVLTADTFTVTDYNTGTVAASTACLYVPNGAWLLTLELAANDTFNNYMLMPGEGILARQTVYAYMSNIEAATVFYG